MALINKKDFSILSNDVSEEFMDDYFECDDVIAPAISLLNKKGYRTKYCCSSHPFRQINSCIISSFDELDDYAGITETLDVKCITTDIDKHPKEEQDQFYVTYMVENTDLYVMFEEDYNFKNVPDIFIARHCEITNHYEIRYDEDFYADYSNLSDFERVSRIYEINKIFFEWVESLEEFDTSAREDEIVNFRFNIPEINKDSIIVTDNGIYRVKILDEALKEEDIWFDKNIAYIDEDYFYLYRGEVTTHSCSILQPGIYKLISDDNTASYMKLPPKSYEDKKKYSVRLHIYQLEPFKPLNLKRS